MKNTLLFALLLFVNIVYCQSTQWTPIESPDKNFMKSLYLTKNGDLFGFTYFDQKLMYKNKLKSDWEEVDIFSYSNLVIKEDIHGNVFVSDRGNLYSFIADSLKLNKIVGLNNSFFYINDFVFLDKGDFILSNSNSLKLYSNSGEVKKSKPFSGNYFVQKDGEEIFLISRNSPFQVIKIDTALNFIDTTVLVNTTLVISNKRWFGTEGYSDDEGKNWHKHNISNVFDYIYDVGRGHDGTIFLSTYNQIYISTDNGDSYKPVQVFGASGAISSGIKYISSSENGEIAALVNKDGCAGVIYSSPDNGKNWQAIPFEDSTSWSSSVCVNDKNNYYVKNLCFYRSKNSTSGNWEDLTFEYEGLDIFPTDLEYDEDGFLYAKGVNNSFVKKPMQTDWIKTKKSPWDNSYGNSTLFKNKDILYSHPQYLDVQYSLDHGVTWQSLTSNALYGKVKFTHSKKAYQYDGGNILNFIDFETDTSAKFNLPENFRLLDMTTTYSTDDFYIIGYNNTSAPSEVNIFVTKDKSLDWKKIPVAIKNNSSWAMLSDYDNNIFIYSEKSLFYLKNGADIVENITPINTNFQKINEIQFGLDGSLYIATGGAGVLKYIGVLNNTSHAAIDNKPIVLYPNPGNERLFVKNTRLGQTFFVYDHMGKLIASFKSTDQEIGVDISEWNKGLYFILSGESHSSFVKI